MTRTGGVKNIVLVHGGFVDGSGWQGVHQILTRDGYEVIVVQNPTISLQDDVTVTRRAIAADSRMRSASAAPRMSGVSSGSTPKRMFSAIVSEKRKGS